MITDTCTWHTRLDTHAHTRYLYEHELGYSMEYAIGTRGGTPARSCMYRARPALTPQRHIESTCYRIGTARISHEVRAGSTDAQEY